MRRQDVRVREPQTCSQLWLVEIVQLIHVVVAVLRTELETDSRYCAPAVYAHDRLGIKLSLRMVVRKLGSGLVKLLIFVPW